MWVHRRPHKIPDGFMLQNTSSNCGPQLGGHTGDLEGGVQMAASQGAVELLGDRNAAIPSPKLAR